MWIAGAMMAFLAAWLAVFTVWLVFALHALWGASRASAAIGLSSVLFGMLYRTEFRIAAISAFVLALYGVLRR